jgi:glycosyltransferase involved in cell wall biosynthesis
MRIAFPHEPATIGGPGSFQERLSYELRKLNWEIVYPPQRERPDAVLVVGGTRQLPWLWQCKREGARIVHRLDGMDWLSNRRRAPEWQRIRARLRNRVVALIRSHLANTVVYQSRFAKDWWDREFGLRSGHHAVVCNGVDLDAFKPNGVERGRRLVCVEGAVEYSPISVGTIDALAREVEHGDLADTFEIYGRVSDAVRRRYASLRKVHIIGPVPREQIPAVYPGSVFVSLDVNPACPNSVIEALASGCPVVAFATGALPELVTSECGILVPYGANVWRLEEPDYGALVRAVGQAFQDRARLSVAARRVAEARYSFSDVLSAYLRLLGKE